ncbi:flagellar assembly peptidoglycan hydrolase FlgJ [Propionivibrio sp.]|uniref:flagellar assembly peptidoglycan hydrolase FlgJ n=1 Tax=Propionivibrio sp. TaxID=2212460 RepID=UPI0039E41B2B
MKAGDLNAPRFVLDTRTTADLRQTLKEDPQAGLRQAARQFEGLLLQTMLKSMRDATPQDGLLDNDQTRFFTAILDQQLAQNLAAKDALGFAKLIEQQLGRSMTPQDGDALNTALGQFQQALSEQRAASSAAVFAGGAGRVGGNGGNGAGGGSVETAEGGREYVNRVLPYAVEAAKTLGVPPHFLVAHSALESGWGKSEIRRADGAPSYNVFGIKAGGGWQGPTVEVQTTEYVDGVARSTREKFRVYGSYGEAFQDYARVLRGNSRFSGVLGQQDGMQFARSLQQSGYATDPDYADKLGRIIGGATLRQALVG